MNIQGETQSPSMSPPTPGHYLNAVATAPVLYRVSIRAGSLPLACEARDERRNRRRKPKVTLPQNQVVDSLRLCRRMCGAACRTVEWVRGFGLCPRLCGQRQNEGQSPKPKNYAYGTAKPCLTSGGKAAKLARSHSLRRRFPRLATIAISSASSTGLATCIW